MRDPYVAVDDVHNAVVHHGQILAGDGGDHVGEGEGGEDRDEQQHGAHG